MLSPVQSCETEQYVHNAKSQVVNTAWGAFTFSGFCEHGPGPHLILPLTTTAIITLLKAKYPDHEPVRRGCRLIMSRQLPDGSWPQESIEGSKSKH